ncbi:hypothetical protein OLZ32_39010 [Rhizobium sp. 1AS11]|uniref:hypothetical protein n=1 Tax=Rhizobium acaciae TaxID=2989736 RepID=UPI002222F139|nr:hypothetical protein [Rhizobium acaciae]MCW1414163.1 hypothetical protein [Rhizobium acaciae]MCW1746315.1 hypothetical protein [Rhizobium acaciae]
MKPTRNFVVEFKSNRRRAPSQAASIWGDTDLKAINREVEDLSPHLFVQTHPPTVAGDVPSSSGSLDSDTAAVAEEPVNDGAREIVPSDPTEASSTHSMVSPAIAEQPADEPLPPPEEPRATVSDKLPGRAQRKLRKARSRARSNARQSRPDGQGSQKSPPPVQDELPGLEAENMRLKALLCARLKTENATLREMLARFS